MTDTGNGGRNGGIIKPVTETVKALAGTPMLLVLLVLNVLILGMITYLLRVRSETMAAERVQIMELLKNCLEQSSDPG
jgi:hypothetical protein